MIHHNTLKREMAKCVRKEETQREEEVRSAPPLRGFRDKKGT
jgi:hypothetical protein